jgi:DNA polymerase I-like protein with 3'-5' exonuclease and polymerase domains
MEHKQTFKVHDVVCTYFYITTDARAFKVLEILDRDDPHTRYGLDIETDHLPEWKGHTPKRGRKAGLCPHLSRIRLVQIYDCKDTVYILDAFHVSKEVIIKILSSKKWVAHNALFEQAHIRKLGPECEQLDIHCSMVQALLLDRAERSPYEPDEDDEDDEEVAEKAVKTQGFGLHALSMKYLDLPLKKEYQVSNWGKEELSREQLAYAAMDAIVTKKLYVELYPKLSIEHHMEPIYKLSCKMIPVLAEMEGTGLLLDDKAHTTLINEWTAELTEIQKYTDQFFPGVNLGSTKQLAAWVKTNLPNLVEDWPLTKKGALAFGRPAISHYKTIPAIKALLEYKKVKKKLDAFGEGMKDFMHPVSKRLHCEYTLAETRTGRLSARLPNLQNQPHEDKFRSLFIAPPGCSMICYDLNQIEIRVDDKVMKSAFTEGVDLHKLIVSRMTGKDVNDIANDSKERKFGKICFPLDTDVLTEHGWVSLEKYDGKSKVAQYVSDVPYNSNTKTSYTGRIEFVDPICYKKFEDQPLVQYKDRNVNLVCTPDHEVIFVGSAGTIKKIKASEVHHMRYVLSGGIMERCSTLTPILTRVLAMCINDGTTKNPLSKKVTLRFKKKRKIDRCRYLLATARIRYYEGSTDDYTVFQAECKDLVLAYARDGKTLGWDNWIYIDPRVYLDECKYWDGFERSAKSGSVHFCTANTQTKDVMQAMAATAGIPCNESKPSKGGYKGTSIHHLSYRLKSTPRWRCKDGTKFIPLEGLHHVACVQVPSGAVLIRYRNSLMISGNCNFGLQFGLGAKKLVKHLAFHMDYVMQEDESYHAIQTYKNLYAGYTAWCEKQRMSAEKLGYVTTPLGKKRKLLKDECYTKAVNCPVQGGAAEVLMCALVLMFMSIRKAGLQGKVRLAATVHDEVILYCQKGLEQQVEQIVSDCMSKGMLVVFRNAIIKGIAKGGHGQSWSEAK